MPQKNLKVKWVVLYGVEVYTPYVIDGGAVATYGFVSPTNHEVQTVRERSKDFFTEQGKSILIQRFLFNVNYNMKIGKRLYLYR